MNQTPLLETERLTLRPPRMEDAAAIFESYGRDEEVTRFLTFAPNQTLEQLEEFMRARLRKMEEGAAITWAITRRGDDTLIGMIELRLHGFKADVGYVLARRFWGQGLMTEALRAVVDFAFTLPGMYRVWAVCDVENVGSARVMEKAGMSFEGVLRRHTRHPNVGTEPRDMCCYAKTR
ncbi:MAG TPA: GNAT family N-acetyltransferase [Pyrinomonadaceae bacterium]|nr:GNAT family N-acetyltransferase [Pyrinomonadaceae bacterium]